LPILDLDRFLFDIVVSFEEMLGNEVVSSEVSIKLFLRINLGAWLKLSAIAGRIFELGLEGVLNTVPDSSLMKIVGFAFTLFLVFEK